jgi:glycyl-tRNA synthetase beta chain
MHPQPVVLGNAEDYYKTLYEAKVMVSPEERRRTIVDECRARALKEKLDLHPNLPETLAQELVNLTEWPEPVLCRFDDDYLEIPHEALRTTMEVNQRFISTVQRHALDATTGFAKLSSWFFGVANVTPKNRDYSEIRKGYERVIRPRFADAKFFYDEDRKTPLASHFDALKSVTYQQQLGSVWDKSVRVAELSRVIANRLGVDAARATRAASLSKCDLVTRMVGEFPELQGVMGRYYATADGEDAGVAQALDEFYRPRFAGDDIAHGDIARVLAVAERLDTLAGIFAVGMKPSGNKDPFALRRAALGLGRTLIEGNLDLDLEALLREAIELLPAIPSKKEAEKSPAESKQALTQELLDFVLERLRGYYAEKGIGGDQFDAVRAVEPESLTDFDARLRAVADFAALPDAAALAAANKRIGNILRQAGDPGGAKIDTALLDAGAEHDLHAHIDNVQRTIAPLIQKRRYVDTLRALAALRAPVDAFFDGVMVMADDAAKRQNRLALLAGLRRMFLQVADISVLQNA